MADYLTKHSMFPFEIKQKTPRALLMLKTLLPLSLWSQKLKNMTFFIQSNSSRLFALFPYNFLLLFT